MIKSYFNLFLNLLYTIFGENQVSSLFITATNTDIGKTYATKKLIKKLSQDGYKVGVFKPIETGVTDTPLDAKELLDCAKEYNPNLKELNAKDITSYTFELPSAPYCADIEGIIDIKKILLKFNELKKLCDILLIEGAGGLMVPIKKDYFMIDLIKELNTKALLITPSHLGCINETLLSIKALEDKKIEFQWCVNLNKDKKSFDRVTKPFYDSYFEKWQLLEDMI
jgi:dethiobiotin synthetase